MKHLIHAEKEWTKTNLNLGNLQTEKVFSSSEYNYIPQEIRNAIQSVETIGYSGQLQIHSRTIHIHIVFPETNKPVKTYKSMAEHMIKRIFLWLSIAEKYACRKCSQEMNIFLYMTDELKLLPRRGSSIGSINANTAFTTQCSHTTDIHLFRKEEWFKVLIHETFHNLGLDFSTMNQDKAEAKINTLFPLNISDVRIFESYCETWAEFLNIMFTAYWNTRDKHDINTILDKMEKYIDLERTYSLFQSIKVLHHYQLKYSDIYQNSEHSANLGKMRMYKEETNAFSYYILKPILLFHLNEFLQWNSIHNGETILDFKKTSTTILKYCGLIEDYYDTPEYLHYMEKMEEYYFAEHNNMFEYQTLRMTIIENAIC